MISLHKFYFDGIMRARTCQERYCQAMFNHLVTIRPELAAEVRGSDKDPFYCESPTDPRWDLFVQYIETRWYS